MEENCYSIGKIESIKMLRTLTGLGLLESKDAVERFFHVFGDGIDLIITPHCFYQFTKFIRLIIEGRIVWEDGKPYPPERREISEQDLINMVTR